MTSLTTTETRVLALACIGMTSKEVAAKLGISLRTVDFHMSNMAKKGQLPPCHGAKNVVRLAHAFGFWGKTDAELQELARERPRTRRR